MNRACSKLLREILSSMGFVGAPKIFMGMSDPSATGFPVGESLFEIVDEVIKVLHSSSSACFKSVTA